MGLGKTLTMIALIASDASSSNLNRNLTRDSLEAASSHTLVVVPPPCEFMREENMKKVAADTIFT
jgi:hypothetical protein